MLATPLVDMLTSFKLMWNKTRLKNKIRDSKINRELKIASLGLDNADVAHLTGITFKPERRSRLIRTLGPLTLMISLAAENRYTDKLENEMKSIFEEQSLYKSVVMFPMVLG